jgi:diguanylate cyclase (GGDEF)-like protein/PAS domain S-box-containing protein
VVDGDGHILSSVVSGNRTLPGSISPAVQQQVLPLLKQDSVTFAPVMGGANGDPLIFIGEKLDRDLYALGAVSTDYLVELQGSITFGRKGHAAIVDQTGKILAHPREEWRREMRDISAIDPVSRMIKGETGVAMFHSPILDQEMIAGFSASSTSGWGAMVPQPLDELEDSAQSLVKITITIGLLGAVAAAILSWWLAGYLARPVVAVTRAARRVARGEAAKVIRLRDSAPTELNSLAMSFNLMVTKISRANRRLQASEARFKDFAETAADWFWETNAEHRFTYLSERFEQSTGTTASECLGATIDAVFGARASSEQLCRQCLQTVDAKKPLEDLELNWKHSDGTVRIQHISGIPYGDQDGTFRGYRGTGRDVTTARQLSQQLSHQASHDSLTGLVNRRELELQLAREIEDVTHSDSQHALCFLDLDQFKIVNDTSGHVAGDELLRQLGEVLKDHVRRGDLVARIGGDEFAVLLKNCSLREALRVTNGLRKAVDDFRFGWEDKLFDVGVSIGLVAVNRDSAKIDKIMRQADAACYAAKEAGRNRVHVYRPDDEHQVRKQGELKWVQRLNAAMDQDALQLHCQEIVALADNSSENKGCEILLRMETEPGELVSASVFLPAAERYNLATRIDRYVIDKVFSWFRLYPTSAQSFDVCTVNLSGQTIGNEEFADFLAIQLADCPLDPRHICFEITETAAIASLSSATRFIARVKQFGCRFALDDFGSGLSSFAYLKSLPVDYLKIDGAFVRDIANDPVDKTMVRSINDMAHALGKETIAEFVESKAVLDLLREIGVDFAQGYFISRPKPLPTDVAAATAYAK